jgi:TRAP-type C4-dicarboxylate transport system permease small subunit
MYPRLVIRTSQAAAVVGLVLFVLMVLMISTGIARYGLPWHQALVPFACVVMSVGFSKRTLLQLQELEKTNEEPTELMVALFDLSLALTSLGLMAIVAWLAALRS